MATDIEVDQALLARYKRMRMPWPMKPRLHALRRSGTDKYWNHFWRDAVLLLPMWEQGGSTVFDISGNNRHGTLVNSPTWGQGMLGPHLQFNGSSTRVTVNDFTYGPAISYLIWFNITLAENSGTNLRHLLNHRYVSAGNPGPALRLYVRGAGAAAPQGQVTAIFGDDDDASINTVFNNIRIDDGKWHMMVLTAQKSVGARLYTDGVLKQATFFSTQTGDSFNPANNIFIGCSEPLTASEFFNGRIAFVGILNRTLRPFEVAELYREPWGWLLPPSGPVFGFRPGQPSGSDPPDFLPEELGTDPYSVY